MSLPSQTGRFSTSGRSNTNMYRRRRNAPKPLLVAGGAALMLGLAGWLFLGGSSEEAEGIAAADGASPPAGGMSVPLGPQSAKASPVRTPPEPNRRTSPPAAPPVVQSELPPLELRQGRPETATVPIQERPPVVNAERTSPANGSTVESSDRYTATPASRPAAQPAPVQSSGGSALAAAGQKLAAGDLVGARELFSVALAESRSVQEQTAIRAELTRINDELVFSRRVTPGDPWAYSYRVQPNDSLARINQRQGLAPDWRLIQRINGMSDPNRLQVGQTLKLVRGPFHAVVKKSDFRLDLYMGPGDDESQWLYIRSFKVGLGEGGSTPVGTFVVRRNSKLINPRWTNPRTGEHFAADDPKNPIGDRWIGIEGIDESAGYVGYGLHGTIEPESIGTEMSMGCVRMNDPDIQLVYELLGEQVSVVRIDP